MLPITAFKAAAAHVAPAYMDARLTTEKAVTLIAEAARNGASLVAFPESFLPGFPLWTAVHAPILTHEHFKRFAAASIFADGPEISMIRHAARRHDIFVSLGFSEASPYSVGCLWNSNVLISNTGEVLNHHRKLVPTFYEKLAWASGDGAGLKVSDTVLGRIGMLICGENTNPLSRYSLIAQGEQIHISSYPPAWPTRLPGDHQNYDNRQANQIRAAAHCFEAKCFGIVVAGFLDEDAKRTIADDNPLARDVLDQSPLAPSMFMGPTGVQIGDPLFDEGLLYAEIDLSNCVEPKRFHDISGGYNRFDIFNLEVNRRRHRPITFTQIKAGIEADLEYNESEPEPAASPAH